MSKKAARKKPVNKKTVRQKGASSSYAAKKVILRRTASQMTTTTKWIRPTTKAAAKNKNSTAQKEAPIRHTATKAPLHKKPSDAKSVQNRKGAPRKLPVKTKRIKEVYVSSYDELRLQLCKLRSSNSNTRICYRGQVQDHLRIDSAMVRRVAAPEFDFGTTVYHRRLWDSVAEQIAAEHFQFGNWDPSITLHARLALAEGLLQHYGFQTHSVDASFNPDIALCFAHYRYRQFYPVLDGNLERPKVRRVAWYEPSPASHGYLYVFESTRWRPGSGHPCHGDAIDLTNLVRPGRNRVQMQQAMVIHSDPHKPNDGDLRPLVRARYKFPVPLAGAEKALDETRMWFPSPEIDPIYRSLLGSRFVELSYITDYPVRAWRRLMTDADCLYVPIELPPSKAARLCIRSLDIPEYYTNPESVKEIEQFTQCDRILEPTLYFPWLKDHLDSVEHAAPSESSSRRKPDHEMLKLVADSNAILVNVPFSDLKRVSSGVAAERYEPKEVVLNVVFEFSPYNFSGPFADDRAIRAVWVGGDADAFLIAVFGAANGRPWVSDVAGQSHLIRR